MTDTSPLGFPEAARQLGVSVRRLRHAIRTGAIQAPPHVSATAVLPAEWLEGVRAAAEASPKVLTDTASQKVPAFEHFRGTSAWQKYRSKAREYKRFRAVARQAQAATAV